MESTAKEWKSISQWKRKPKKYMVICWNDFRFVWWFKLYVIAIDSVSPAVWHNVLHPPEHIGTQILNASLINKSLLSKNISWWRTSSEEWRCIIQIQEADWISELIGNKKLIRSGGCISHHMTLHDDVDAEADMANHHWMMWRGHGSGS